MIRSLVLKRAVVFGAFLLFHYSSLRTARAEEATKDPALAHELFDQGRALMQQGDYDRACAKFEESRRLDPGGGGGGTLLNLALCEEKRGKTGTAWALFRAARSLAVRDRREDRQQFADEHIASLTPRLSRLRVVVPPEARLPGVVVLRNGVVLGENEWGEALVVDPGTQTVEARAPGHVPDRVVVDVHGEGVSFETSIPILKASPRARNDKAIHPSHVKAPAVAEVLVGGAGLTAMTVGGVFGLRAIHRSHDADALCPNYDRCDPQGIALSADAARDGRISVAMFVGGAAVLTAAVIAYFVTGHSPPPARAAAALPASLAVRF